jgi:branched-chain amino acid transport system ATP-binding protein
MPGGERTASAETGPLLSVRGLRKSFGALPVIAGVDLQVDAGQALGILGPNGAGKSTLFNLITGDLRPDAGSVCLDGQEVSRLPPSARCLRGIGRSYQVPRPFTGMTVFENVLVGASFGGRLDAAGAVEHGVRVLERTGLIARANDLAGSLPLLDRKRLELARALSTRPKLLLLDEIAGGLTDLEAQALVETIRAIRAEGTAIVWIEHVVHALLAVAERLLVLNFGTLVVEGVAAEVMASREVREIYLGIEA